MTDIYVPSGANKAFADISAFVADDNAIDPDTKTALNTGLTNIKQLFGYETGTSPTANTIHGAAHPDFNKIPKEQRDQIINEIDTLIAAVTAHA